MLPPTTIFDGDDHRVGEGCSHTYECWLAEEDGSDLQAAAITQALGWLDDHATGTAINSRTAQGLINEHEGTIVDVGGKARFRWALTTLDAVIVGSPAPAIERHRITLKFTYTKSGGGTGTLTKRAFYDVESFERI